MGIPIEKSFVVKAPAARVWEFLTDPNQVAGCLPGAAITGKEDDQVWGGTMTVKVGPVTASYRGKLRFEKLDAESGEAEIAASGQETRGKGGADMRMKSRVVQRSPGETEVTVSSDVNVVGVLAQFGRGMIQDVSDQIFRKFTDAMRRQLEAPGGAPAAGAAAEPASGPAVAPAGTEPEAAPAAKVVTGPAAGPATQEAAATADVPPPPPPGTQEKEDVLDVGALGAGALGRAARRTLRRPGFWFTVVTLALIVYWLLTGH